MLNKSLVSLTFAAACLVAMPLAQAMPTEMITNGPQVNPGDHSSGWSAARNVRESQNYERLLQRNRAFRQARMRKECGPITDPGLHASCLASFNGVNTMSGSSTPSEPMRNGEGN